MKNLVFKSVLKPVWLVLIAFLAFGFVACDNDDDNNGDNGGDDDIVLDGFYIKGDATAFTNLSDSARMEVTKNEVTQTERSSLYEAYVTIESSGGFNIVQVAGSDQMTYGPDNVKVVGSGDRTVNEPQVDFKRGSYTETDTKFSVSENGLYHVAIDTEVNKIVIVPVKYWGVIGAATPGGWSQDTKLEPGSFNLQSMTFEKTNVELRTGEWKLRYSGGWKVVVDTTVQLDGGDKGVRVNTSMGGSLGNLQYTNTNLSNDNPGVYTVTMDWTLGEGYSASIEKTGDIPTTDWTGVDLDIVGEAVSSDNPDAIQDTSSWGWGNALLADNSGDPTVDGELYTWTWTKVIIEGSGGFKVRTENGSPAPENDMSVDLGFGAVDTDNSSSLIEDASGNISASQRDTFNIQTTIDAANADAKTITITEWSK